MSDLGTATATAAIPAAQLAGERRLAWVLRLAGLAFAVGTIGFVTRPDGTVTDLNLPGTLVGMPALVPAAGPVGSDFWFALAIANMTTITACCWIAAADVRHRRALVYPVIVSKFTSSGFGLLLFVGWSMAFPFLAITLVDLPIGLVLIWALRGARPSG